MMISSIINYATIPLDVSEGLTFSYAGHCFKNFTVTISVSINHFSFCLAFFLNGLYDRVFRLLPHTKYVNTFTIHRLADDFPVTIRMQSRVFFNFSDKVCCFD